jgi:branched-chain amino acid transport system permease protein
MNTLTGTGIVKHFGGIKALDGVDIAIAEGEILGLVGPNGSGKSTLINVLSGYYRADSGRATFDGDDLLRLGPHEIAAAGLARTFQIPRPFRTMTARENVALSYMFGQRRHSLAEARRAAGQWLEFTDLLEVADLPIDQLTLHQLKFLELARSLATEPKLLLLDEVLAGLNPTEVEESIHMIQRIHAQGVTLVIVEHLVRVVMALSTTLTVLDQGRVIAQGDPETVMGQPEVIRAYLGSRWEHA